MKTLGFFIALLLLSASNASSTGQSNWNGSYDPAGEMCERSVLTIQDSNVAYRDCVGAQVLFLEWHDDTFAFQVDEKEKCNLSGWVIALKGDRSAMVTVQAYRSLEDANSDRPAFECRYRRRE